MAWFRECTPTQRRILDVLKDGHAHRRDDMICTVYDVVGGGPIDQSYIKNLQMTISSIRKILQPQGEDILCVTRGYVHYYQHVRLLGSPYREGPAADSSK